MSHIIEGRLYVPYYNYAGKVGSRFLTELRDGKRIMGIKCHKCGIRYVPPRSICPKCYGKLDEWVSVSDKGTLLTYTVVNYTYTPSYQPCEAPYVLGIIQLDGADTGLCHLLGEVASSKLKVGLRVQAVFKEKREGSILDIKYFKPL